MGSVRLKFIIGTKQKVEVSCSCSMRKWLGGMNYKLVSVHAKRSAVASMR